LFAPGEFDQYQSEVAFADFVQNHPQVDADSMLDFVLLVFN
jgi:hypothetical protein